MKNILFLASVLILIFNSCCPDSCDCDDEPDRMIVIAFDTTIKSGYQIKEIDTIQLISLNDDLKIKESLFLYLNSNSLSYNFGWGSIKFGLDINNKFNNGGNYIKNYNIITQNSDTFLIRNINIKGHNWSEKNCKKCTCFVLDEKTLDIDGKSFNLSPKEKGGLGDETIYLKRK